MRICLVGVGSREESTYQLEIVGDGWSHELSQLYLP